MTLVTGASGFVGRALCAALAVNGYKVRAALRRPDAASAGKRVSAQNVLVGEIGPETAWSQALDAVDCVVHLAARVHIMRETASEPLAEYRKVNVAGTERLAREAATASVRRFIYLSSIKVNGEVTFDHPFTETDAPNPQDAYGISKWEAEQALHRIGRESKMEMVILRPPLVYGPHVKGNFLSLLRAVDRGWPLPLGSIHNARSLIYLGNLADAIIRCISHASAAGQTFLVSDSEDVSTPELIERVAKAFARHSRLIPFPPALLNVAARLIGKNGAAARLTGWLQTDSSKFCRELEWRAPYSMDAGLAATASWYRGEREKGAAV
ncbi:MAG: UDP-glucose 4-epimerase family protein [Burkholderiales bacterium]